MLSPFCRSTAKEYMPSHFNTGNLILANLKTVIHPWSDIFFRSDILKMRLQFHRPICWSIFSLCISLNAFADERSSTQKIDREMATSSADIRNNRSRPVLTVTKSIQGHNEQEAEAMGEEELRSSKQIAFAGGPSYALKIGQKLASDITKTENNKNESTLTESNRTRSQYEQEVEAIAEAGLRSGEQVAMAKPLSPKLKMGRELVTPIAKTEDYKKPVFIEADLIQGYSELEIEGIGNAELRSGDQVITANRMKYFQNTDDIEVEGDVRVERGGNVLEGSRLKMNLESKIGQIDQPQFSLRDGSSRGSANIVLLEGEGRYRFRQAYYTTCPEGNEDWIIQADDLELNDNEKIGTGRHAKLTFLGVPIAYTPWFDFSYSGERKSGFLAPTYGSNSKTGFDVSLPFYWNIAPNLDATFKARGMTKRGIMANTEIRYLTSDLSGNLIFDILPNDLEAEPVEKKTRYRVQFAHNQYLGRGWSARLNYSKVSDDTFFTDLGKGLKATSRTNLLQQGLVSYKGSLGQDGTLSFRANVQRYQTLQDPVNPIDPPYKRLPEIVLEATQLNVFGTDLSFSGSWTDFNHIFKLDGKRYTLYPNVSIPLRNRFGYLKPKIGVHHTGYDLEFDPLAPLSNKNPDRTLPLVSLDSGATFDRAITLGGEQFTQTIEPRFFYLYVPHENQDLLPNFDSDNMDFSFARMFTENRFSGSDRINDANRITLALTSRLIDSDTGIERLRVAIGQRLNIESPRIKIIKPDQLNTNPDFIAEISGRITPSISANATLQFDQSKLRNEIVRSTISYRPETGKVINLGYRYTRGVLEQTDISAHWPLPLFKRWQGVGRLNYSLRDNQILEGLAGLEYNACCWTARFVLQHLATSTTTTNTTFFFQLQLNGLLEIGSDPIKVLQRSIPGYTKTSDQNDQLELR